MARGRKTKWIDSIQTDLQTLAGAADPGTLANLVMVSSVETQNAQGATIVKVVGQLILRQFEGVPVITAALHVESPQSSSEDDWTALAFQQRAGIMWTGIWVGTTALPVVVIDLNVRTKRVVNHGGELILSLQNHSAASNSVQYVFHLRTLLLLP